MTNSALQPDDFLPTASLDVLRQRDRLLRELRSFFHSRDFIEVTTPILSRDTVIDRHLDPFEAKPHGGQSAAGQFLQTSPEFHMKRLLAAGAKSIFQIGPAFRVGERGQLHNPEFTMVEWYRVGDDQFGGIDLLSELVEATLGSKADRISYRNAFIAHVGFDPLACGLDQLREKVATVDKQAHVVDSASAAPNALSLDADGCLEWLFVDRVQPRLQTPTIVFNYPASQAALAKTRTDDDGTLVAERFELFAHGIELANGYHELLDADELMRRNAENNRLRILDGKEPLPEGSYLIDAMRHGLPACAGVALGLDRLLMLKCRCDSIDEVLCFPSDRA